MKEWCSRENESDAGSDDSGGVMLGRDMEAGGGGQEGLYRNITQVELHLHTSHLHLHTFTCTPAPGGCGRVPAEEGR